MAKIFIFVLSIAISSVFGNVISGALEAPTTETYNLTATTENPLDTFPGTYYLLYRWGGYPGQKSTCETFQYLPLEEPEDLHCTCAGRKSPEIVAAIRVDKYTQPQEKVVVDIVDSRTTLNKAYVDNCNCNFSSNRNLLWRVQKGFFIKCLFGEMFTMYKLYSKVVPEQEELEAVVKSVTELRGRSGVAVCKQEDVPTTTASPIVINKVSEN